MIYVIPGYASISDGRSSSFNTFIILILLMVQSLSRTRMIGKESKSYS
jgi:hypothetical protein